MQNANNGNNGDQNEEESFIVKSTLNLFRGKFFGNRHEGAFQMALTVGVVSSCLSMFAPNMTATPEYSGRFVLVLVGAMLAGAYGGYLRETQTDQNGFQRRPS